MIPSPCLRAITIHTAPDPDSVCRDPVSGCTVAITIHTGPDPDSVCHDPVSGGTVAITIHTGPVSDSVFMILSQAVLWQWQYTTDPNPNNGLWLDMETSVLRPIVTNRRITSHNCFNISTTNLTFERVSRSDFGKYYRCYVIRGDTEYVQYAAVYKLRENKKKLGNPHSGAAVVGRVGGRLVDAL